MSLNRRDPRRVGAVIAALTDELQPMTLLAAVQRAWPAAAGEAIAAVAHPTSAREGTVIVTCESSVWAQELELMGPELVDRLNAMLDGVTVAGLRCRATATAAWARS